MANLAKLQGFCYIFAFKTRSTAEFLRPTIQRGLDFLFCCKHILLFVTSLLKAHREFQVAVLKSKTFRWCGWRQLCGFEVQINKLFSSCMCVVVVSRRKHFVLKNLFIVKFTMFGHALVTLFALVFCLRYF